MATLTPQFFELLETREMDIFFKATEMLPTLYTELFETKTSTKAFDDAIRIAGLGTFAVKPEGTPIAFDDPVQGTRVRWVHTAYGLGWRASREMMKDDQFNVMDRMSADLGDSARDHLERIVWDVINDAYSGTRHTGLEGEVLASSTHARLRGGTASNILSPPIALSQAGIEAMMDLATSTLSDEGRVQNLDQAILLVPTALQHLAYVLLQTEFKPNSSLNDRNTVAATRSGLRPLVVPSSYYPSTTNWSVHAAKGRNHLTWSEREPLEFMQAPDAETLDRKHYAYRRGNAHFSEWRGNFFSQA